MHQIQKAAPMIRAIGHTDALTPSERDEFERLWLAASVEAFKQGVMLIHPMLTGDQNMRGMLHALRDGTWRKRISE